MRSAEASALRRWELPRADVALPQWLVALAYLVLTCIAVWPILAFDVPPLVDYPNHLARLHVLTAIDRNPLLAERYAVEWNILPNLAMDVIVYGLAKWLPVADILRLFVAVSMALIVAGTLAVSRQLHGQIGLMPAMAFLLVYNHVLAFGFINFYFGVGLYLVTLAGWLAARGWPAWARLALFSAASVALFFAHLFAFGVYGLTIMACEFWHWRRAKEGLSRAALARWFVAGGQFAVPVALWAMSRIPERNGFVHWGSVPDKLIALVAPIWCYDEPVDTVIYIVLGVLLIRGLFSRRLSLAPAMRYPLAALAVAAVLMPNWLMGVWGVDFRLPVVIALLFAASARIELASFRAGVALAAIGLVLFGARIWTMAETFRGYNAQYAEFRQAAQVIPPGARLLTAQQKREGRFDQPYWHLGSLAVIDRSVFLPNLFKDPTAQPVRATPAYRYIDTPYGTPLTADRLRWGADDPTLGGMAGKNLPMGYRVFWGDWPRNFDYLLYVHFGDRENPVPKHLKHVRAGSYFDIYQIVR